MSVSLQSFYAVNILIIAILSGVSDSFEYEIGSGGFGYATCFNHNLTLAPVK